MYNTCAFTCDWALLLQTNDGAWGTGFLVQVRNIPPLSASPIGDVKPQQNDRRIEKYIEEITRSDERNRRRLTNPQQYQAAEEVYRDRQQTNARQLVQKQQSQDNWTTDTSANGTKLFLVTYEHVLRGKETVKLYFRPKYEGNFNIVTLRLKDNAKQFWHTKAKGEIDSSSWKDVAVLPIVMLEGTVNFPEQFDPAPDLLHRNEKPP